MQSPGEMMWEGSKGFGWHPWQENMPLPGRRYTTSPCRLTGSRGWKQQGFPSGHRNQFVRVTSMHVSPHTWQIPRHDPQRSMLMAFKEYGRRTGSASFLHPTTFIVTLMWLWSRLSLSHYKAPHFLVSSLFLPFFLLIPGIKTTHSNTN